MSKSEHAINKQWPTFIKRIHARLEMGSLTYGDISFAKPLDQLIDEIMQELEDQAGWSFIAWSRLDEWKKRLEHERQGAGHRGA